MRPAALALCMLGFVNCAERVTATDGGSPIDHATSDTTADDAADRADSDAGPDGLCPLGTCHNEPSDPTCSPPDGPLSGCCACGADGQCRVRCTCASPDTPIATPGGERPIASIVPGDLVDSVDRGRRVAVAVLRVNRTPVAHHVVVRVTLGNGRVLHVSPGHPTADGRTFGALRAGDWLGGQRVDEASLEPYTHEATYDILPASDTGTYFAGGALVGSTLAEVTVQDVDAARRCAMPARRAAGDGHER